MADAEVKKKPKVVYGLKNIHYAILTKAEDGTVSYGTPIRFPGAVNLALSADGETTEFYADDMVYYSVEQNNGYTGDFEAALVPDDFIINVLGDEKNADGILYEVAGVETKHIALLGEFATDAVAKRICLYDVLCGRPDISHKTKEKTNTPQTQKMSITARPIEINGKNYVKCSTTPETSADAYNNFFKSVKMPGTTTA